MNAQEIYDKIIGMTPKVDGSTPASQYLTGHKYIRYTANLPFEVLVWEMCKPNTELANQVMDIAEEQLKNVDITFNDDVILPKQEIDINSIYIDELKKINKLQQNQNSLMDQCEILRLFANKLGLYDAADLLNNKIFY